MWSVPEFTLLQHSVFLKVHIETLRTAGAVTVVPKIECVMTDTDSGHIDDVVNGRGVVA